MRFAIVILTTLLLAVTAGPAWAATYGGGALTIADTFVSPTLAAPFPSVLNVPGGGVIQDVNVRLPAVTHGSPDELDILLVGPGGQTVMLMSDAADGASFSNFDIVFDDEAGVPVPADPVTRMSYVPTNNAIDADDFPAPAPAAPYGGSLTAFDNTLVEGDWRLYISDDTPWTGGSISRWQLITTERGRLSLRVHGSDATEADGVLPVTIWRDAGGLAAEVDVATAGAPPPYVLATPGEDYVPVSATLSFAPNETVKTFNVPLINDTIFEPTLETIPITLSNAKGDVSVGGGPGGTAAYGVGLREDDRAPQPPPPVRAASLARPAVTGTTTQRLLRQKLRIRVRATSKVDGAIGATGTITIPKRTKKVQLTGSKVPAKANVAVTLSVKVKKKDAALVRRALRRYRKLQATIAVGAQDVTGKRSALANFRVTLKP